MKKALLISIVVMTLFCGCSKKQTVSIASTEPLKDSCLIVKFSDNTECYYRLFRDSINDIRMEQPYLLALSEDMEKYEGLIYATVSEDIIDWFEDDCSFTVIDSVRRIRYVLGFRSLGWFYDDELNPTNIEL